MMESSYRDRYFKHLCQTIEFIDPSHPDYEFLLLDLMDIEFYAVHPMDENRIGDAANYRAVYFRDYGIPSGMEGTPCSFLEVLVALAKRFGFLVSGLSEDLTKYCFWKMIENCGLSVFDNLHYHQNGGKLEVWEIVTRIMDRTYEINGVGGLFPMRCPKQNQREVELFYQMNQYIQDPNGLEFVRTYSIRDV